MRRVGARLGLSRLHRRTGALLGGLLVLGVLAGGVAWATIPGEDGVIHACYSRSGGALRVIDASVKSCKKGETAIWWNQSGPPGEPGQQGEPGPGVVFTKLDLSGGVNYIELHEGENTPIHTLELPEEFASPELVVLATVWITNWGDASVDAGCTVLGSGGFDWPFTLQHGFNEITFQGSLGGDDRTIELSCSVDATPAGEIWFERAAMTAFPQIAAPE